MQGMRTSAKLRYMGVLGVVAGVTQAFGYTENAGVIIAALNLVAFVPRVTRPTRPARPRPEKPPATPTPGETYMTSRDYLLSKGRAYDTDDTADLGCIVSTMCAARNCPPLRSVHTDRAGIERTRNCWPVSVLDDAFAQLLEEEKVRLAAAEVQS